jgi:hypothetical protein
MKKIFTQRGLSPYEAPEAEVLSIEMELNILSGENTPNGGSTPDDLVEEDYSSIWG